MTRRYQRLLTMVLVGVFLFGAAGVALAAAGAVYYGGYGWDHGWCGSKWAPCGTHSYAHGRACQLSNDNQTIYYVYHVNDGYAGFCDKTGGSGTEPRARQAHSLESMLTAMFVMAVVGFAAGSIFYGVIKRENA